MNEYAHVAAEIDEELVATGPDIAEMRVEATTRAAIQAPDARWTTPAERALALGHRGIQIPTGTETLDKACRGGPRTRHFVVFGGAPGSGKTTFAVHLATRLAKQGVHVGILAADEDADGLLVRIGQNLGFKRDDLESAEPETRAAFAERLMLDLPTLMLVDAEEERCTVEDLSAELRRRRGDGPSVLILDSIQRVSSSRPLPVDTPRARVESAVYAAARSQKIDGHLVLATCELSRAAYRGGKDEAIEDLAAFAESRAVEYFATTALVMRSVVEQDWLVDVTMPKNRNGTKKPFRLRLDPWRASMHEVGVDPVADEDEQQAKSIDDVRSRILKALQREPLRSRAALALRVKGRKATIVAALKELIDEGRVVETPEGPRVVQEAS